MHQCQSPAAPCSTVQHGQHRLLQGAQLQGSTHCIQPMTVGGLFCFRQAACSLANVAKHALKGVTPACRGSRAQDLIAKCHEVLHGSRNSECPSAPALEASSTFWVLSMHPTSRHVIFMKMMHPRAKLSLLLLGSSSVHGKLPDNSLPSNVPLLPCLTLPEQPMQLRFQSCTCASGIYAMPQPERQRLTETMAAESSLPTSLNCMVVWKDPVPSCRQPLQVTCSNTTE